MRIELRRLRRTMLATALLTGMVAAPAGAFTAYPINDTPLEGPTRGSTFTSDTDGWQSVLAECTLIVIPEAVCHEDNLYNGGEGIPQGPTSDKGPGSLEARHETAVGLLDLATGASIWKSPSFVIRSPLDAGQTAKFFMDKKVTITGALLEVGSTAATTVTLVDQSVTPAVRTDIVVDADFPAATEADPWQTVNGKAVAADKITAGHRYHLEVRTDSSSTLQAALGQIHTFYDNIRLRVDDATDTGEVAPAITTLPATEVGRETAVLNSNINPKGTTTVYGYEYAPSTTYADPASRTVLTGGVIGTELEDEHSPNGVQVGGLLPCTTYTFSAVAYNEINSFATRVNGGPQTITTACRPSAVTQPASPVSGNSAGLNSSVNPSGLNTTVVYEYGSVATGALTRTAALDAGFDREVRSPLTTVVSGLTPETDYRYRVIATNADGESVGAFVTFRTTPLTGPQGPPGITALIGLPGSGVAGSTINQILQNGDERALMKFRSGEVILNTRGRRAGIIRLRIFCSEKVGKLCAGTIKIRTANKVQPATRPPKRKLRRVTLVTSAYQLRQGRSGFAIMQLAPEKIDFMRRVKSIRVTLEMQVTDAAGNRQTIIKNTRMRIARRGGV
jgi:hypothetical protein